MCLCYTTSVTLEIWQNKLYWHSTICWETVGVQFVLAHHIYGYMQQIINSNLTATYVALNWHLTAMHIIY